MTANINTKPHCSTLKGHLVMVAAIAAIVALFTILDVQISLARIDPSDATTSAHLARPQVAYFFIPLLAAVVAAAAVIVNFILGLVLRRRLSRRLHWAMLGAAFALVSIGQPVSAMGLNSLFVLWLSIAAAVLSAVFVRWHYGAPHIRAAM